MVLIVMGISGSGKTTIGRMLARKLSLPFHDADDYHPVRNIRKMERGIPLDDQDRAPWLLNLAARIESWNRGPGAVLACSALKEKYRRVLTSHGDKDVTFIHLEADRDTILKRMKRRRGHFFSSALLDSQFQILEPPRAGITVENTGKPQDACTSIIKKLPKDNSAGSVLPLGSTLPASTS